MQITDTLRTRGILSQALRGLARPWPWGWVSILAAPALAYGITHVPPLIAAAVVLGPVAAFFFLRRPVWGAYALVLSVPVQKAVTYNAGPVEVTVTQGLFVFVLAIWWAW